MLIAPSESALSGLLSAPAAPAPLAGDAAFPQLLDALVATDAAPSAATTPQPQGPEGTRTDSGGTSSGSVATGMTGAAMAGQALVSTAPAPRTEPDEPGEARSPDEDAPEHDSATDAVAAGVLLPTLIPLPTSPLVAGPAPSGESPSGTPDSGADIRVVALGGIQSAGARVRVSTDLEAGTGPAAAQQARNPLTELPLEVSDLETPSRAGAPGESTGPATTNQVAPAGPAGAAGPVGVVATPEGRAAPAPIVETGAADPTTQAQAPMGAILAPQAAVEPAAGTFASPVLAPTATGASGDGSLPQEDGPRLTLLNLAPPPGTLVLDPSQPTPDSAGVPQTAPASVAAGATAAGQAASTEEAAPVPEALSPAGRVGLPVLQPDEQAIETPAPQGAGQPDGAQAAPMDGQAAAAPVMQPAGSLAQPTAPPTAQAAYSAPTRVAAPDEGRNATSPGAVAASVTGTGTLGVAGVASTPQPNPGSGAAQASAVEPGTVRGQAVIPQSTPPTAEPRRSAASAPDAQTTDADAVVTPPVLPAGSPAEEALAATQATTDGPGISEGGLAAADRRRQFSLLRGTIPLRSALRVDPATLTASSATPAGSGHVAAAPDGVQPFERALGSEAGNGPEVAGLSEAPGVLPDPAGSAFATPATNPAAPASATAAHSGAGHAPSSLGLDGPADQVVAAARLHVRSEGGTVEMHLDPPELGHVRLKVSLENGALTAFLGTETAAARQALESQVGAMRQALHESGLPIQSLQVGLDLSLGNPGDRQPQAQDGGALPRWAEGNQSPTPRPVPAAATQRASDRGGIDFLA